MTHLEFYHSEIHKGNIIVGQELHRELDRLMDDLNDRRYVYDTRDADIRIDFMQNCIKLTKSPFYGKPMILLPWQKAFIETLYSFKMRDMEYINPAGIKKLVDRFKEALLLEARKNAKTETCSGLADTEFVVGNEGSDIVLSSNDDSQADILYAACDIMRSMIDPKSKDTQRKINHLLNKITNSKMFKISDRTRNKDGRNIDFAIIDEIHEMKELDVIMAIRQSMSLKINPKLIMITTEGTVNGGALDELLKEYRKILNGEDDSISAERKLPWLYTQDSEEEIYIDESSWYKSNPSLGPIKQWQYLRENVDEAKKSPIKRAMILTKDFNVKQNAARTWLSREDYENPATFKIQDFEKSVCLGAVDLALTTDLVNAKAQFMKAGDSTKYWLSHYWICENKLTKSPDIEEGAKYEEWAKKGLLTIVPGNEVDPAIVAEWYYMLYQNYGIITIACGYDQRYASVFKSKMEEYGFKPEMIVQSKAVLNAPTLLLESDLQSRLINYNNNEIDAWCFGNAALEFDRHGDLCQVVKIPNMKGKKVDGAVTGVMLEEMHRRYKDEYMNSLSR